MDQQKRIINLAHGRIFCIGLSTTRQWGKSFTAGFETGVKFTLENQWISTKEQLPEANEEGASDPVLILGKNGAITRAIYAPAIKSWFCCDAGFSLGCQIVTHWMPIPKLNNNL